MIVNFIAHRLVKHSIKCSHNFQFIRWRKMPLWVPRSPGQLFKTDLKPDYDEDETKDLLERKKIYDIEMKSLLYVFGCWPTCLNNISYW